MATAHHAGQVALDPQPSHAPLGCATEFGPTSQAAPVAVANDGTVFASPLVNPALTHTGYGFDPTAKIVSSSNRGANWSPVAGTPNGVMSWMNYEPSTGRLWYTTSYTSAQGIFRSDDDGHTWSGTQVCCPKVEGAPKILEGPAPGGGHLTGSYPNVVYFCANLSEEGATANFGPNLNCYKSLDGGATFTQVGGFPDNLSETGNACRNRTRPGVVGPDGALYFPVVTCANGVSGLGVRVSTDEGKSWTAPVTVVSGAQPDGLFNSNLGVDGAGNLYFAWLGSGGLPTLSISTDHGQDWSALAVVAAPAVVHTIEPLAITVAEPGHVAIAYVGSTDTRAAGTTDDPMAFDGYITETRNALDANPVFWSAVVNDPGQPLEVSPAPTSPADVARGFTNRVLYRTADIGPDGTPWAGFHCYRAPSCPIGSDPLDATGNDRIGVVGDLYWTDAAKGSCAAVEGRPCFGPGSGTTR